jgi:hypothetical protein
MTTFKDIEKLESDLWEACGQPPRQLKAHLQEPMRDWTQNTSTQAEVKVFILDTLWQSLPARPSLMRTPRCLPIGFTTTSGREARPQEQEPRSRP